MKKHWLAVMMIIFGLTISAGMMSAQGKKNGKGKGHEAREDKDRGKDKDKSKDRDDDRWERNGKYEYRTYGRDDRPPGWSEGKKVGWGYCGMPPGQAKKYGCRTYVYEGRSYYYYRGDDDRIIVRRPTLNVHVDIVR